MLRKRERMKLNAMLVEAGWDTANARKGVAVRLTASPNRGECGQITYRFDDDTARSLLAGELPIPTPR